MSLPNEFRPLVAADPARYVGIVKGRGEAWAFHFRFFCRKLQVLVQFGFAKVPEVM